MKIINKKEFLELPSGVLYSNYIPAYFEGLYIKKETISDTDFTFQILIVEIDAHDADEADNMLVASELHGQELPIDFDSSRRDGLHDPNQLFAVYSKDEIKKMSEIISKCKSFES
jgi:hypothetical protein